jgi:hypothetical protein
MTGPNQRTRRRAPRIADSCPPERYGNKVEGTSLDIAHFGKPNNGHTPEAEVRRVMPYKPLAFWLPGGVWIPSVEPG